MTLKIFGHKSPDTDATCSPIIWAWYMSTIHDAPATPYLLGQPNNEALFVLDRFKLAKPEILGPLSENDDVIIVDTNNPDELPDDLSRANIVQLVDHHKLAGLVSSAPLDVIIRPLASTASVMYETMNPDQRSHMPQSIAGIMLCCVLSDTLQFRSPTTTDRDQEIADELATSLDIDMDELANEMFAAKSDISAFSDAELLRMDSKVFELPSGKHRVSVLETTAPQVVLNRSEELISAMDSIKSEDSVDEVLLFIIDILNEEATLLIPNDNVRSIAEKAFDITTEGDTVVLPGVVSRKKQIVPALSK